VDDRGYIWLEVPEWDEDFTGEGEGCLYHLLSPEGEFLGIIRAPAAGRIMKGHLLGVLKDSQTGADIYAAWRLVAQSEGFIYP
jgi:hypothetical protein